MMNFIKSGKTLLKYVSICIVLICSIFFVACKDKNPEDPNRVASISLSEELVSRIFYKNDNVDFSQYDITINYTKSSSVVLKMNDSNVIIENFSTEVPGTHKATIKYADTSVYLYYAVLDVDAVGLYYNGDPLTIYSQETFDFSKVNVEILYSNGSHSPISLDKVSIGEINKSCSSNVRNLTVSYLGFNTNVGYRVTNRAVVESKMYSFEDKTGLFDSSLNYIMKSGDSFIFYKNSDGEVGFQTNYISAEFNTFEVSKFANSELKTFVLTLVNNTIICTEKAL